MNKLTIFRLIMGVCVALMVAACASIGRPEGGPRDEAPPRFIRSNPAPGSTNVNVDRLTIVFDENIQVKDVMNKVVVSPPMASMPKVTGVGHSVRVEFSDTLKPNTTYTVDFTDAISDLNEGNELEGFAFDFSTGPTIDSLCISGMVFEAINLEPAQSMLVGVHSNLADSAISTIPFDRITRTNQYGQFTIRNLKPGKYRVYAIKDVNRDNKWDRTEDIAFYDVVVEPTSSRVEVADTLMASDGADSIVMRMATAFAPNDLLLTWFNEDYKSQYLSKYERRDRNRFYFEFGDKNASLPEIRFVGGRMDGELIDRYTRLDASPTRDTLDYWLTDTAIVAMDSLRLSVKYQRTDKNDSLVWATDTLNFHMRKAKTKAKKVEPKSVADSDSVATPKIELMKLNIPGGSLEVYSPLEITLPKPLGEIDQSKIHLEIQRDTLWVPVSFNPPALADSLRPMRLVSDVTWEPGEKYRLTVDSLAVTDIYGMYNGEQKSEFSIKSLNEYGNITFSVRGASGPAVVQLLDGQDKPVAAAEVVNGRARFNNVKPNAYYARLFLDANGNGVYDKGNVAQQRQPEETFYYPKKIQLKKNWDMDLDWDIYETPVDLQKPKEIKKNKPKQKKGETGRDSDEEDEDQYYDEFGNPAVDPDDPFGKRKNSRNTTLRGRDQNTRTQGAGYR